MRTNHHVGIAGDYADRVNDASAMPQPNAAPPSSRKGPSRRALLWLIGCGVVLLALVIALAVNLSGASKPARPAASDLVKAYLTALADGDAETALSLVTLGPNKTDTLLTHEMLAASLKLAPISEVSVKETPSTSGVIDVPATFTLGDRAVAHVFRVADISDEGWRVTNGTFLVELPYLQGLAPTVNGVEASGGIITLFPGGYQLGLGQRSFTLPESKEAILAVETADFRELSAAQPQLTDEAQSEFRSLVRASLEECNSLKTLTTPCGMELNDVRLPADHFPVEGSVTRTLTPEGSAALDALKPTGKGRQRSTVVSATPAIGVDMTFKAEKNGVQVPYRKFGSVPNTPTVDFAAADPVVVWE